MCIEKLFLLILNMLEQIFNSFYKWMEDILITKPEVDSAHSRPYTTEFDFTKPLTMEERIQLKNDLLPAASRMTAVLQEEVKEFDRLFPSQQRTRQDSISSQTSFLSSLSSSSSHSNSIFPQGNLVQPSSLSLSH